MDDDVDPLDAYMATLAIPDAARAADDANGVWAQRRSASDADAQASEQQQEIRMIKNRRYRRLQQLLLREGDAIESDTGTSDWYFSDALMQQRSPALFHFHLGQYLPTDGTSVSGDPVTSGADPRLSAFLLGTWERSEMESRRVSEQRAWKGFQGVDDAAASRRTRALWRHDGNQDTDDEEEEEEEEDDEEAKEDSDLLADAVDAMSIEDRRQQLIDVMARRLLDGCDHEYIQYDEIDTNEALDDWAQLEQDAEDAYFG